MKKRKPILLVDDTIESIQVRKNLFTSNIEFIEYDIKKFGGSCCGHLPTVIAPSIFAPEGIFKGKESIEEYIRKTLIGTLEKERTIEESN